MANITEIGAALFTKRAGKKLLSIHSHPPLFLKTSPCNRILLQAELLLEALKQRYSKEEFVSNNGIFGPIYNPSEPNMFLFEFILNTSVCNHLSFFSELCWGRAIVAYTMPQKGTIPSKAMLSYSRAGNCFSHRP